MNLLEGHADELRGALVEYVENALAETGGDER